MAFIPAYILILGADDRHRLRGGSLARAQSTGPARRWLLMRQHRRDVRRAVRLQVLLLLHRHVRGVWPACFGWTLHGPSRSAIILPIGLSFHTFQSLSYVIEVYHGRQKAERSFVTYAIYVMFFPQLVAGPIERPQNLLHQFHETHTLRLRPGHQRPQADGVGLLQEAGHRRSAGALRQRRLRRARRTSTGCS